MEAVTNIVTIRTMAMVFGLTHEGPSLSDSSGSRFGPAFATTRSLHFQFRFSSKFIQFSSRATCSWSESTGSGARRARKMPFD